jgi:glycosyltransferase involved in cell wall biosynthesis
MLELAQELTLRGHSVTVITTWPEYNLDQSLVRQDFAELENEAGIRVIRVKTLPHHNVNYLVRGLSQLLMPVQFLMRLKRYRVKPDVAVIYSPPLPLALVGTWLKRTGAKTILNIQDLFPQNAIDLGILKSQLQIRFFKFIENLSYRTNDFVTVHSEGNRKLLVEEHPELEPKLRLLHNWVDIEHHDSSSQQIDFKKKWSISQRYVAVFAGVMGPSQYLDLILSIAERMASRTDLLFLFVGDGKEKQRLQNIASEKGLTNVRFEGFISRDNYPDLLHCCDIGLVCLSPQNNTPVVPGKILGHMAAGLPVAGFLHRASDAHEMIRAADCGVSAYSDDLDACVHALENLIQSDEELLRLGRNGQEYAAKHFSKKACVDQLQALMQ